MTRRKLKGFWALARNLRMVLVPLVVIPLVLTLLYLVVKSISVPMAARLLAGRPMEWRWRDIAEVSDRLKAAVILSEDGQFCRHDGVDLGRCVMR